MKKLFFAFLFFSILCSCSSSSSKIDKSLLIGTWTVDNSLVSAKDTVDYTVNTNSNEAINDDGTYEETFTVFLNNGFLSMKRHFVRFGTWNITDDTLNIKVNNQHDDDGTIRELNITQKRRIISIAPNEYVYSVESDSTKDNHSVVMKRVSE